MIHMSLEENAAATPSGTRPLSIEVADTSPGGPEIHRQVLDSGAGAAPDAVNELDAAGLGLLVSRRLLSALGGWLELKANSHGGCTVAVSLPVAGRPRKAGLSWKAPVPVVLVVSASNVARDGFAEQLETLGLEASIGECPD